MIEITINIFPELWAIAFIFASFFFAGAIAAVGCAWAGAWENRAVYAKQ